MNERLQKGPCQPPRQMQTVHSSSTLPCCASQFSFNDAHVAAAAAMRACPDRTSRGNKGEKQEMDGVSSVLFFGGPRLSQMVKKIMYLFLGDRLGLGLLPCLVRETLCLGLLCNTLRFGLFGDSLGLGNASLSRSINKWK